MDLHDHYPLRTVTRLTGLSPDVIRAWEKRYDVVSPTRGPRGARMYTHRDITRLRLLANVVRDGRTIGDVAKLDNTTLQALTTGRQAAEDGESAKQNLSSAEILIDAVLEAVDNYDRRGMCDRLADGLAALGASRFVSTVCTPLLRLVGERWHDGELSIAQEHMATNALRTLLQTAIQMRSSRTFAKILLATPAGERHEGGLLMTALLLAEAGIGVSYLGVDTPATDIVTAAAGLNVAVVGLSISAGNDTKEMAREIRSIDERLPKHTELWLGGAGASAMAQHFNSNRLAVFTDVPAAIRRASLLR